MKPASLVGNDKKCLAWPEDMTKGAGELLTPCSMRLTRRCRPYHDVRLRFRQLR